MLDKAKTKAALVAVLRKVQASSGRACPDITDRLKPIGDLDGFDSLLAIEATVLLEQELGCTLADGTPFISEDGQKALSMREVIDRVIEMVVPEAAA